MEQEKKRIEPKEESALSGAGARFCQGALKLLKRGARRAVTAAVGVRGAFESALEAGWKEKGRRTTGILIAVSTLAGIAVVSAVISLAVFPLGVYPAGFALLSAVGGTGKLRFWGVGEKNAAVLETVVLLTCFSGALISCVFLEQYRLFYLLAYLLLFLIRAFRTGGSFRDSLLFRVTFSAGVATGLGMLLALFEGFSVNRVFGAVSLGILTPILTYLISGFYIYSAVQTEAGEGPHSRRRVYLEASVFTLFYLFLFALRNAELLGFSLSFVLAVVATLATARLRGALFGAAAGMIGGMACVGENLAPALAVGGFFSGLFFEYSAPVAVMIAFVSSCGYSLFTEGFSEFAFFTTDFLCGILLFSPLARLLPKEGVMQVRSAPREVIHRETVRRTRQKLKNMSDAFSSLSQVFYTVSDTMKKPTITEASRLVADCCRQVCSGCDRFSACWSEGSEFSGASASAAARLLTEGRVEAADFAAPFSSGCKYEGKLVERVNRRFEQMCGGEMKNNRTGLLAGEYSSVSRLLRSTAGELDRELEYNPAFEERARKVLERLGIPFRRVAVFGSREMKIDVYGVALERVSLATDGILAAFGKEFSCRFEAPDFLMFEESVVMRLRRGRAVSLECAKSGCTKKGEAVSGDSCLFFETERDLFYTLICDGMGSGREAAFTSRLSSIFIEKLMHCATPKNVTLEMLNTFLMAKTDETFTTVDLLEVDLLSGEANFIKAGAAPSFVLRGDRLHRIESRTPPAGALVRMCAEQTAFRLRPGDFVILMSDGAEAAGDGSGWLVRLLAGSAYENAAALCDAVFHAARERGAFRDDLSISVVKIMNAK
ncbi:MAG: SpoIIE family protein phosphatase [Clostridia bacterium]|nr:SpoIIE family protein phosphatase [Clostridia bacterium]